MSALTFDESTAAITRIARLQNELLDYTGHVTRGMSRDDQRITLDEIVEALDDDGDRYELPDGRTVVLKIEPDDVDAFENINDCDAYGRVAWPSRWPRGEAHGRWGNERRPDDMTGRAVKLRTMGGDSFWWEPYHEGGAFTPPTSAERQWMADLVTFGFRYVSLRLMETVTDSRGNDHEVETAHVGLGGIDTVDQYPQGFDGPCVRNGYLRDILSDLLAELDIK